MMKSADSPYWKRPQYAALTAGKWDVVVIMLGTNDAKDAGSGGPHNWPHNCTGANALDCPFAQVLYLYCTYEYGTRTLLRV